MAITLETPRRLAPGEGRADSVLTPCRIGAKTFYTLVQRGSFADCCYDHGRLLAAEIEEGVFPEILDTIAADTDASSDAEAGFLDRLFDALFSRVTHELHAATGAEFRQGIAALEAGYFDGLADPAFASSDVVRACYAIDAGNVSTGIVRLMAKPGHPRAAAVADYALGALTRFGRGRAEENLHARLARDRKGLASAVRGAFAGRRPAGMGCTGFFVGADAADGGRALHARTFDGAFFAWNAHPVLHLVDERPADAGYLRYAAVGTAGLVYPGGISGVNEAGLACSLHQMSTVRFATGRRDRGFEIAPYVQQRILREARTLEDAVAIAEAVKHFASWTILVSEAGGRALRIEINGSEDADGHYEQTVVASAPAPRMVQTNHFLAASMAEKLAFWDDRHFTKTVGKWLETRARMRSVGGRLDLTAAGATLDTAEALGVMAGHDDADAGGRRAFGRTVCKSYGLMGSIVRAAADRAAGDEIWFTIGDRLPGPHATLAGFAIDWDALTLTFTDAIEAASVEAPVRAALAAYVDAFRSCERPRHADGRYYGRRPTPDEMIALRREALGHLDRAVAGAENAGFMDPGFRYIRARLAHEAGMAEGGAEAVGHFGAAARDWDHLRGLIGGAAVPLDAWEEALIQILAAATDHALDRGDETARDALVDAGLAALERVAVREFGAGGRVHQDIKDWRSVAEAIKARGAGADLPPIDWVTVE